MQGIWLSPEAEWRYCEMEREGVSGKGIALEVSIANIPCAADVEQEAKSRLRLCVCMCVSVQKNQIWEFKCVYQDHGVTDCPFSIPKSFLFSLSC